MESEPEEESASDASETSPAGLAELEGAIRAQTRAQHEYKYFHGYLWVHPWENLYKQITCLQVPSA